MSTVSIGIIQDLSVILNNIKSKDESLKDLSMNQLSTFLNTNRDYIDEIIEEMCKFLENEKESIEEPFFYKLILKFCSKLEEKNISIIKFINKAFPILMGRIFYFKEEKKTENKQLYKIISYFTKKCENINTAQIEFNLNTIFEKLTDDKNPPDDLYKYGLIKVLQTFLKNAPLVCFGKIMASTEKFKKIISNFKDKDESIRKAVQDLIQEFLLILFNKDPDVRKKNSEMIYTNCIKAFLNIDKKNNSYEIINLSVMSCMKIFTVSKNGKINEILKENYDTCLNFIFENLNNDKLSIKLLAIQIIPDFCQYITIFKQENSIRIGDILNKLLSMYQQKKVDEKIKYEILKTLGKLSRIESLKEIFGTKMMKIIGLIRNEFSDKNPFNESILDSFSDFMFFYGEEFSSIFTFEVYYKLFFISGLKECHILFLKRVLEIYKNHPLQFLPINLCVLNIISYRITGEEFNFNITYKKRLLSSDENNKKKKEAKKNSNTNIFKSFLSINKSNARDNNKSEDFDADFYRYYNDIGDIMINYIKEKKDKDKGYDNTNEVIIALTILGFIDCDILIRDVLNFYVEHCLILAKGQDKNIKIKVIKLANSKWIPEIENKKINLAIVHNKNYVLEYLINLLLLEPDDEIKLIILDVIDNQRFYELLSKNNFFVNFISIIEYDNNLVKEKTIKIVSQLIKYNYSSINAFVREKILQIYACLVNSNNQYRKEENIILLTYLVKYMGNHIVNEIEILFSTLLGLLKEETNFNKAISESKKQNEIIILGILSLISELMINQYYNKSKIEEYIKDIILISISILDDNLSTSSLKEETVLYTILSILTFSNKEWNIYSEFTNLVKIIIRILKKSQNKNSRLYALKILGNIGAINPSILNKILNLHQNKEETELDFNLKISNKNEEGMNISNDENVEGGEKNKIKNLIKLNKAKQKCNNNYDFQKAINEKKLDKNTYYSMQILMKLIISNNNYDVTIRVIYLLKDIIQQLNIEEESIIYLILPTLLSCLNNFEENTKYLILELILLITKNFKNPILFHIENILNIVESYITEEMKNARIFKDSNENRKIDICLDIIDKMCELYSEEISYTYTRIIPLILNILSEREYISVNSKIKVISCLNNMGGSLSKYLYLIIPEINNCLNSLTNKKLWLNYQNTTKGQLKSSSSFYISSNNINIAMNENFNERKTQDQRANSLDSNNPGKILGHELLNLINNLIKLPGIIKYFEKLIQVLCFYMGLSDSDVDKKTIIEIFIKMLDTYQNAFLVYYPYVIKIIKELGIPYLDYFHRLKYGLEKRDILSLILKKNPDIRTFLPYIGNESSNASRNDSVNSVKETADKKITDSPYKSSINKSVYIKSTRTISKLGISDNDFTQGLTRDVKGAIKSIIKEFDTSGCKNDEDWHEWFKYSTKKLFEQSPSYIIYSCHKNNVYEPQIINELYNSAFYSLWKECEETQRIILGNNLQIIIQQEKIPKNIALIILNLIEFINKEENEEIELADFNQIGNIAYSCQAFAKALFYVENDYINNDSTDDLIKLINLYINLGLSESALGIYRLAQMKSKNSFNNLLNEKNLHLKMHQWQKAKQQIEDMQKNEEENNMEKDKSLIIKKAMCLEGLSDWENLLQLDDELIKLDSNDFKEQDELKINISLILSKAALNLGEWDKLKSYVSQIKYVEEGDVYEENFFKAIISIKESEYDKAQKYIDIARESIDERIKSLLNESYERAYKSLLDNENLCELEDIIKLKGSKLSTEEYNKMKENLRKRWDKTLLLKDEDISIYERILAIRKIIFTPEEDYLNSLRLSQICRKSNQFATCMLVLNRLQNNLLNSSPDVTTRVKLEIGRCLHDDYHDSNNLNKAVKELENIINDIISLHGDKIDDKLKSNIYCCYGVWCAEKIGNVFNKDEVNKILKDLELSTKYNINNYKAWHSYALLNYKFFESEKKLLHTNYAINAIEGFTKSICIGGSNISKILQDLLLLINIWFQIGNEEYIDKLMNEKIDIISIDCWLLVIPQLLARINVTNPLIRKTLILLLKKIGLKNPRSLTYPLTVLHNSKSKTRAEAVSLILEEIKKEHPKLFKECELIINELNRCALCLHEQWSETIEEGAKLFFQSKDPKGSAKILLELHQKMKAKPETMNEIHFYQSYKGNLNAAYKLIQDYLENNNYTSFKEAWDIYHTIFRSMSINFSNFEILDLKSISPALFQFQESEIEMPGIHQGGINGIENSIIKISSFNRHLTVLNSKQHPRKIVLYGSDGKEYPFLLKGHEDIRQDERVMQLFGLINALLSKDSDTRKKNLFIKRYSVIPLSHNTGIIGWVSNCDTLHQLIKDYRNRNKVRVNIEHFLMAKFHPKFDSALKHVKLEVFKHALNNTLGIDIYKVLWNKSQNAEDWLERRTNYSRSMAVMSIVGYILGLGDRHPSNIMLDRVSGKVIHIDFGDCFEVAMKREKFPEKVPFRLTRMLIKAFEIGGIEGAYRITCENVMRVVREHKDSLNVILAAFVHDPLISFRLLIPLIMKQAKNKNKSDVDNEKDDIKKEEKEENNEKVMDEIINNSKKDENELEKKRIGSDERQLYNELEEKDDIESDDLNQIAKIVLERISDKLNGTDFNKNEELKVKEQVKQLIDQATSHENLSQSYLGWCPFW